MGGQAVHNYAAGAIPAGSALELEVSGKPASATAGRRHRADGPNAAIGLGVLGGLLILAGYGVPPERSGGTSRARRASRREIKPIVCWGPLPSWTMRTPLRPGRWTKRRTVLDVSASSARCERRCANP